MNIPLMKQSLTATQAWKSQGKKMKKELHGDRNVTLSLSVAQICTIKLRSTQWKKTEH